jgi:hypothetical protein
MPIDAQRDINLALLRCVIDSHKAVTAFVVYANANADEVDAAKAAHTALLEKMTSAFDRCIDLIEKADNDR